jgi:pyruvate dehydrogenase (quinone)
MWRGWGDPRLPILVLDNGDLNEVTWEQREMEGDPMFPASQAVTSIPYAAYAELLGLEGLVVDDPDGVGPAWDAALAADRPFLIHAVVDPAVPLMPPRLEPAMKEKLLAGLRAEGTALAARARELALAELADQEA